jgi:hypothetical protein
MKKPDASCAGLNYFFLPSINASPWAQVDDLIRVHLGERIHAQTAQPRRFV